jgi:hypothetical protein
LLERLGRRGVARPDQRAVPAVNYVRFDVTTGQRMILDAVAVVPEAGWSDSSSLVDLLTRRRA